MEGWVEVKSSFKLCSYRIESFGWGGGKGLRYGGGKCPRGGISFVSKEVLAD